MMTDDYRRFFGQSCRVCRWLRDEPKPSGGTAYCDNPKVTVERFERAIIHGWLCRLSEEGGKE